MDRGRGKNSSYFSGLEKRRQERNAINVLLINDVECTDPRLISEVYRFYTKLYSSSYTLDESFAFLESIKTHIPKIDLAFKET